MDALTVDTCQEHAPEPDGYLEWFRWAGEMHRQGYRQKRCPGCDRFKIWVQSA